MFMVAWRNDEEPKQGSNELAVETAMTVLRPSFKEMVWRALGGALLTLGFAFFRQIATWFLTGVSASGIDVSEVPYGQAKPIVRPSLFGSPTTTSTTQTTTTSNAGNVDINEFR